MNVNMIRPECISRIVAFCHSLQFETNGPLSYLASPVQLGSAHQKRRAYFDDLHAMNVESIRARCGASAEVAIAASFEPELPDPAKLANIWQMLKSIEIGQSAYRGSWLSATVCSLKPMVH